MTRDSPTLDDLYGPGAQDADDEAFAVVSQPTTPLRKCSDCGEVLGHCLANCRRGEREPFKPSGTCTCAGPDGPCEACIANKEAYEEWLRDGEREPACTPIADLRASAMEMMGRRRIAVEPEFEGNWLASLYDENEQPTHTARGPTPEEAVIAVVAAEADGV
jgi:hypothetical protein